MSSSRALKRKHERWEETDKDLPVKRQNNGLGTTKYHEPLTSLNAFVSNLFFLLAIQDDDEVAADVFGKFYARNVKQE
jgi:hypothetical protein